MRPLALLLLTSLGFAGCSGSHGTSKGRDAIAALRSRGISAQPRGSGGSELLGVRPAVYRLADGQVEIFRFPSAEAARKHAKRVDPGGYGVRSESGAVQVEWVAPPHWFRSGGSIVLYLGTSTRVLEALRALAGPQFAGT
jgi:hypothetical protein